MKKFTGTAVSFAVFAALCVALALAVKGAIEKKTALF